MSSQVNISSIIFDFDGTLVDSKQGIELAFYRMLDHFKINKHSCNVNDFIGPPLDESLKQLFDTNAKVDRAIKEFRHHYFAEGVYLSRAYRGITPLLKKLTDMGIKLYICTSKKESVAIEMLESKKLNEYFIKVYGAHDGVRTKKEDIVKFAIEDANLDVNNTLMLGDTVYDLKASEAVDMKFIYCGYGYGNLEPEDVEYYIEKPSQFMNIFKKLQAK